MFLVVFILKTAKFVLDFTFELLKINFDSIVATLRRHWHFQKNSDRLFCQIIVIEVNRGKSINVIGLLSRTKPIRPLDWITILGDGYSRCSFRVFGQRSTQNCKFSMEIPCKYSFSWTEHLNLTYVISCFSVIDFNSDFRFRFLFSFLTFFSRTTNYPRFVSPIAWMILPPERWKRTR